MTELIHLEIAGVHFLINSPFPSIPTKSEYLPFIRAEDSLQSSSKIEIQLMVDGLEFPKDSALLFESEQSWIMYRDADEYQIIFDPPQSKGDPFWRARFLFGATKVQVECGERLINRDGDSIVISNPVQYPLDQLLLVHHIATRDGALIHAAGIEIHGKGLIFPGRSGAGKSTLSRQLSDRSGGLRILSDDRIVIRKIGNDYTMFGTPWPGEAGIVKNENAPLSGILFIHHATYNTITKIEPKDALKQLLPVVSIPWFDDALMPHILNFCEEMVTSLPAYNLHFKPTTEVAVYIEDYFAENI
jgi:hypothetical protein